MKNPSQAFLGTQTHLTLLAHSPSMHTDTTGIICPPTTTGATAAA